MSRWIRPVGPAALAVVVAAGALVPVTVVTAAAPATAADSVTGVDVSSWQHPNNLAGDINWTKVKAAGHDFAIIKATERDNYKNPFYASDVANARAAGLVVGAYHFARPKLPLSTATTQAKYFVATTGKMRTARTLPPVLDIEDSGGLSKANTIAWSKQFLSTVRALTGRTPMIYSYDNFLRTSLGNTNELKGYPLWYAKYTKTPPGALPGGWNTWSIWQHTSSGTVSGMKGRIDLNKFNGSTSALLRLADGTKAAPISPGAPTTLSASLLWPDAKLTWKAPTTTGGSPITKYMVTVDGVPAGSTPTTSFVAGPLAAGNHTFQVSAVTIAGTGPATSLTLAIPTPAPGTTAAPPATSTVSLSTATTASRGSTYAITATLRRADTRQAVTGHTVTIRVKPKKGASKTFNLTTNVEGAATALVSHRANSTVSVAYTGGSRLLASAASVTVKVRPKPSIKLISKVKRGRTAYLRGGVSSLYVGETVRRQRYYAGAWRTVATAKVSSTGAYKFTIKVGRTKGKLTYRVQLNATSLHLAGVSSTKKVRVV